MIRQIFALGCVMLALCAVIGMYFADNSECRLALASLLFTAFNGLWVLK